MSNIEFIDPRDFNDTCERCGIRIIVQDDIYLKTDTGLLCEQCMHEELDDEEA